MKSATVCLALVLLFALAACRSSNEASPASRPQAASGGGSNTHVPARSGFDYYLLNLSWSPEFCYSHPSAAECGSHSTFVLHGIWPQNNDGTFPENCLNAPGPSDPSSFSDLYPDPGLLEHEWRTHGTCSGLSADAFFSIARAAVHSITIPPELNGLSSQVSMPPDEIVSLFTRSNPAIPRESIAISCGHNYLTAVEFCLDKSLHPIACGPIRSCRANSVRIPPPS